VNDAPVAKASVEGTESLVGYCYTRARRHPLVIGRFPGGGQLWGGPYTIPQAIVIAGSFVVLLVFRPLWAHFGLLLNVVIAVAVPYTLGLAAKRVNVDGRNPLAVAGSVLTLVASPATGRMGGKPLKDLTRRQVRGVCTVTWQAPGDALVPLAPVRGEQHLPEQERSAPAFTSGDPRGLTVTSVLPQSRAHRRARDDTRAQVLSAAGALLAARNPTTRTKED
jgi:hypothetical protein